MPKKRPVDTSSKEIEGQTVLISVYRSRIGFYAEWSCLEIDCSGCTNLEPSIEKAIFWAECKAAVAIRFKLRDISQ